MYHSTVWAHTAHQSLGDNTDDRIGNQIIFYSHVCQTCDCAGSTIGMQCADYQVSRNRCFDGNRCGLLVSDLTDHDDVRILSQDGS